MSAARPTYLDGDASLFRLLVQSVREYAIFALDTEGRIVSWNVGAERTKGYTAQEILGEHFSRFFTPRRPFARASHKAAADRIGGGERLL